MPSNGIQNTSKLEADLKGNLKMIAEGHTIAVSSIEMPILQGSLSCTA